MYTPIASALSRLQCFDGISFKVASQGKSPFILQAKHRDPCIVLLFYFPLPVDMISILIYAAVNGQLELTLLKDRQRCDTVPTSNLKVYKFREWWIFT